MCSSTTCMQPMWIKCVCYLWGTWCFPGQDGWWCCLTSLGQARWLAWHSLHSPPLVSWTSVACNWEETILHKNWICIMKFSYYIQYKKCIYVYISIQVCSTYNSLVLIFTIFWLNWWACFISPRDSSVSGSRRSFRIASGTKIWERKDK